MEEGKAEELKRRSRAAFDAQAATYDAGMEGEHVRALYPLVAGEVARAALGNPAPRLLDLGCGTGALARAVLDRVPGARVTCADLSPRMAEAAAARLGGCAEVVVCDAENLPFRDGAFDVAWCNDSFHHYPDPGAGRVPGLAGARRGRRLRARGRMAARPARALMNAWMPRSREGDVRIYSEAEMSGILGAWFDSVEWRRVGLTACLAVARKGRW